jgi:hypothetical protein
MGLSFFRLVITIRTLSTALSPSCSTTTVQVLIGPDYIFYA